MASGEARVDVTDGRINVAVGGSVAVGVRVGGGGEELGSVGAAVGAGVGAAQLPDPLDRLADMLEEHLDLAAVARIAGLVEAS